MSRTSRNLLLGLGIGLVAGFAWMAWAHTLSESCGEDFGPWFPELLAALQGWQAPTLVGLADPWPGTSGPA